MADRIWKTFKTNDGFYHVENKPPVKALYYARKSTNLNKVRWSIDGRSYLEILKTKDDFYQI